MSTSTKYDLLNQFHSEPRKLKVIHVGAGASGLLLAYKAERMLTNYELICYDKNPVIGGTWYESRYPGCACDVPAHIYTFSFEPKPDWSTYYANSSEIHEYFLAFAHKYDLEKYFQLRTTVVRATWDGENGKWTVELERNGERFTDSCDVLVNGSGVVNKARWPAIPGRDKFQGIAAHSAQWDPSITWADKRVAIIGVGSSAVQLLPQLAKGSKSVHLFARNAIWITPQMGTDVRDASKYSDAEKQRFREDPEGFLKYRKSLEATFNRGFPFFIRGSALNQWATAALRENMLQKLKAGSEELRQKLIPSWSPGCRRPTPGPEFLETLVQDHVKTVFEGVAELTSSGLVTTGGAAFDFDLIVCATGFHISYVPHFDIVGVDSVRMKDEWAKSPNIYLSITGPKFPNYFVTNGPTGNWGQGCVLPSHEVQVEYALQCCRKMQEEDIKALEVKELPTAQWNEHVDTWHNNLSVWADNCRSWYKRDTTDGRVHIWPGSILHMVKTLQTPRFEHYNITYHHNNPWSFLGNGRTLLEKLDEDGVEVDLAPYIRNSDGSWSVLAPGAVVTK